MKKNILIVGFLILLSHSFAGTINKAELLGVIQSVEGQFVTLKAETGIYKVPKNTFPKATVLEKDKIVTAYLSWTDFQNLKPL
jgi:hypothetical protein